jgi:hypothetical protein
MAAYRATSVHNSGAFIPPFLWSSSLNFRQHFAFLSVKTQKTRWLVSRSGWPGTAVDATDAQCWTVTCHRSPTRSLFRLTPSATIWTDEQLSLVHVRLQTGAEYYSAGTGPSVGPTHPHIQWIHEALSPRVKRQERESNNSPPSKAEDKNTWLHSSTPHTSSCRGVTCLQFALHISVRLRGQNDWAFYMTLHTLPQSTPSPTVIWTAVR